MERMTHGVLDDDFHADADTTKKEKYALSSSRTSNKSDESTAQNKIGHCTYLVFFRGGILHRGSFQRLFLGIQNFDSHDRKRARHTLKFFSSFALHTSSSCWFVNGITDCIVCPIVKDKPKTQQLPIRKPLSVCVLFLEARGKETRYVATIIETRNPSQGLQKCSLVGNNYCI